MNTKDEKKSSSRKFMEQVTGGPLTLASLIHAIRIGEELSQEEFAHRLGISKSHLCDIEKGRKHVSPVRAMNFAKILEYSEQQFVRLALQEIVNQLNHKPVWYVDLKNTI